MLTPLNFLKVRKGEKNILEARLDKPVDPGIKYEAIVPGIVPPFEEHRARRLGGYTLTEWRLLDPIERAIEVLQTRLEDAVRVFQEEARING